MTFRQQIFLTILDKALIALVLAIAGFWLNRYLESFKSRQALENELRKTRDQKRLDLLQSQLTQFYWPVYLHLQMDNAVWEKILLRGSKNQDKAILARQIERDFILPNHAATCKLIEANIHLAAPDPDLMKTILGYLRHVAVYQALRASGNQDIDPIAVDEPWPRDIFPSVQAATVAKQHEFEEILKQHIP